MPLDQDSLHYFVSRWLEKSRHAADGHDAPFVDEFVFAYIAFNAAYTAAAYVVDGPSELFSRWSYQRGGLPRKRFPKYFSEEARATKLVVLLTGEGVLQELMQSMHEQLAALRNLFDSGRLFLHESEDGAPDEAKDRQLLDAIEREDPVALLRLIYLLRCNLFHGAKQLTELQRLPLSVGTTFLRGAIPILLDGIERRANRSNRS